MIKNIIILLLILLGLIMMYLGYEKSILPPLITGIGFILIAILFKIKEK